VLPTARGVPIETRAVEGSADAARAGAADALSLGDGIGAGVAAFGAAEAPEIAAADASATKLSEPTNRPGDLNMAMSPETPTRNALEAFRGSSPLRRCRAK